MSDSFFTDERDYVITEVRDSGQRLRTVSFVWRDGRRSSITLDVAWDSEEMRDKLIRSWAAMTRIRGDDVKRRPVGR